MGMMFSAAGPQELHNVRDWRETSLDVVRSWIFHRKISKYRRGRQYESATIDV
jgi:hypothetical protein